MSQATLSSGPYLNSDLFSGYYLDERIDDLDAWDCDEEAREAFDELRSRWDEERGLVEGYNEDTLLGKWIDEVLGSLGYDTIQETSLPNTGGYIDRVLFDSEADRRDAMAMKQDGQLSGTFGKASVLLEAKQWDADFTKRFAEQRSYRDASHQVKYYLEHTPDTLQWGILTNGRKWRLYGTKDYATETYYEVDLPELLDSGNLQAFKYFFAFFRPEAFRETAGTTFLDTVWNESETAAQELGEDLQDNVFTALRVLGEGFVESNDLDIDPEDEAAREELKEQSLVLLYRLMFVLYAESRHLIHPDDPDAEDDYRENFSLDQLRLDIHQAIESGDSFDDYSAFSTGMWSRLQDLFRLVDSGEERLGIPPYNGGLFDHDSHEFLAEHDVANRYIAEVIYRLGTTETDDGSFVLADYADLDTRHLGTIYEGLLEHEFRIASEQYAAVSKDGGQVWKPATEVSVAEAVETVEPGELYVVNDDGERKATGAYYTPDYVVTYIVEETIDPLLDDIHDDLTADGLEPSDRKYFARYWQEVLDLKVLDPAMGSGHFLTKATGYLTERVMEVVREQEIQSYDEQDLRREIAKECIYGVDLNGMAVELAKLSMWLETLAADKPLAFLDHHLKAGNSLVGSDITEVLSNGSDEDEDGQITLFEVAAMARKRTLEHVMDRMSELLAIDNDELADIKSMEELYDEIREDPLYGRLFELANVHTAEQFGLGVPEGVYEKMAGAIEDEGEWAEIHEHDWFVSAQTMADEEDFFHWELEYPEVFFGSDGEKLDDAGFDAVVGNPPYASVEGGLERYLRQKYQSPQYFVDLFHTFIEEGIQLTSAYGEFGYIVPEPWLTMENTESLRQVILNTSEIRNITHFEEKVFEAAAVDTIVLRVATNFDGSVEVRAADNSADQMGNIEIRNTLVQSQFERNQNLRFETRLTRREEELLTRLESDFATLEDITRASIGIQAYNSSKHSKETIEDRAFHADHKKGDDYYPEISGRDVSRFHIEHDGETWVKYGNHLHDYRPMEFFTSPRVLVREITDAGRYKIHTAHTDEELINYKTILNILPDTNHDPKYISAIMNSRLLSWIFPLVSNKVVSETFPRISVADLKTLPIPSPLDEATNQEYVDELTTLASTATDARKELNSLNTSLIDYLGNYTDGSTLSDIGLTQPPKNAADSILQETTEQKPNLRVGEATVHRESPNTVEIRLTARYKPDPEQKGRDAYTETDPLPALRVTDLTETEADLIEAFVPVAADEAGGFANFRETATKTNSLIDRLRKLTLPRVDDGRDGLQSYIETKERAEELEGKIERTDDLIDEIVYELYGLTDEEIEIVEEAVGE